MDFKYNLKGDLNGFGNLIEVVLENRGIKNVKEFLNPSETHLEKEDLYDNMELGYVKLIEHINKNSNIIIVVD